MQPLFPAARGMPVLRDPKTGVHRQNREFAFMRKYLLAGLLAATAAGPALAQEAAPFSGVRVEGVAGYDTTDVEGAGSDGVTYGAQLGYAVQSGGAVFGVEAEATDSTIDECVSDVDLAGDELCVEAGRDLYVGGRAGAAVSRNVLVYAK